MAQVNWPVDLMYLNEWNLFFLAAYDRTKKLSASIGYILLILTSSKFNLNVCYAIMSIVTDVILILAKGI